MLLTNNTHQNALERLYLFMKRFRNETKRRKGQNLVWTHTMTYEPYGSYNIPEEHYDEFLQLYEDAIIQGYHPHITEKHREIGPIVIDIDFVQNIPDRQYLEEHIIHIVQCYHQVVRRYLAVWGYQLTVYILEKDAPSLRNGKYHDGIHLVYPLICTRPDLQMLLRQRFIEIAQQEKLLENLRLENRWEEIFDKSVIYATGWMMYGSCKNTHASVYRLTHIYMTFNGRLHDIFIDPKELDTPRWVGHLVRTLSCRKFMDPGRITPLAKHLTFQQVEREIDELRGRMVESVGNEQALNCLMGQEARVVRTTTNDQLAEARALVRFFSRERATNYHTWYQVGHCLHNIDDRLLEDWVQFSQKCPEKFKPGECARLWARMKSCNYTMASLHYFAAQDSPEEYRKWRQERLERLLNEGIDASHHNIAKLVIERHKFMFKCASIKHGVWYQFRKHRWHEVDSAYTLRILISQELTTEYARLQKDFYDRSNTLTGRERDKCIDDATYISKVIQKLNNFNFKNGVVRECADLAYDPIFLKNLDENIYLLGFENGVYDLEADIFREGCPDDCISMSTGYDYIPYQPDDEVAQNIKDFFAKIQPDKEMREYLLTLLSTCLAGSIAEESIYVFTGSGANGKSKLMELLKYTLGDYYKPTDVRVLTERRGSASAASPEIADKKGVRASPFDEPRANDEINASFMKLFTGGDLIMARALFKDPIYFRPQFKPFLLCNNLPNIRADDDGTWRRIKVVPFLSKFIKPSEATEKILREGLPKDHFWADVRLSEKLPEWRQVFMGMLIQYYRKYKREGLVHPKLVLEYTMEYRKRCDIFQDFLGEYVEKSQQESDTITVTCLHEGMRTWYRSNYDGKCPSTKELRNYLAQRFPTFNKRTDMLTFYRLRTQDDTIDKIATIN